MSEEGLIVVFFYVLGPYSSDYAQSTEVSAKSDKGQEVQSRPNGMYIPIMSSSSLYALQALHTREGNIELHFVRD